MKRIRIASALFAFMFFISFYAGAADMNDDTRAGFTPLDVISLLKMLTDMTDSPEIKRIREGGAEVSLTEAVYMLRKTAGINGTTRTLDAVSSRDIADRLILKISNSIGGTYDQVIVEIKAEGPPELIDMIGGAAFTVEYNPALILNGVESDFFGTFESQGITTGLDSDRTAYGYDSPLIYNPDGIAGEVKIAAARCGVVPGSDPLLFTLSFSLKPGATPGTYPIHIKPTVLNNVSAGYAPEGEAIDILIGINEDSADPADAYPVLIGKEMNEQGYSVYAEPGSVTFFDDSDNSPVTTRDNDTLSDLQKAVLLLKVLTGDNARLEADMNNNGKVGIEDAVYLLQIIAGIRPPMTEQIETLQSEKSRITSPDVSEADSDELVSRNTEFALDFYHAITDGEENIFFSPYSISLALAMTYAGAMNDTETEMAQTLHFTLTQDRLHPAFNALDIALTSRGEGAEGQDDQGFRLNIANSIWGQTGYPFLDSFLDRLAENYGAGLQLLDFSKDADACRLTINNWVSDQTEEKIKDLLPAGSVSSLTRLVLTNAIYFNAAWKFPFEESLTQDAPFYLLDGSEVSVPMMSRLEAEGFGYTEGDNYKAVELKYDGNELSMIILIPGTGQFNTFEDSLTTTQLSAIIESFELRNIELKMPKFRHESASISLKDMLMNMGMPTAFSADADFSGINGEQSLFISDVIHKAFVSVDEAGTEAAAATGVVMNETAIMPADITLTIDRPFIFFIRDIPTGAILFAGRIINPL